jgi:Uma2 family endonuclease
VPELHPELEEARAAAADTANGALDSSAPHLPTDLESDDGEPLESAWHRAAMNLLIESITYHFRDRNDFFVGGNMFLHFSDQKVWNRDFRGPDFFYVSGVDRFKQRDYYATFLEGGQMPHVIVELTSPSTAKVDRTTKKELYQKVLRVPEYLLYDPATNRVEGWRLGDGTYAAISVADNGRAWSKELSVWLGSWTGEFQGTVATWPRFFDAKGQLVLLPAEAERLRAEQAEAEVARLQREIEALRRQTPPTS